MALISHVRILKKAFPPASSENCNGSGLVRALSSLCSQNRSRSSLGAWPEHAVPFKCCQARMLNHLSALNDAIFERVDYFSTFVDFEI